MAKSFMFSDASVRPVLRRGCRKGWKRMGRRPARLTCARAKASDTPGPVRKPDGQRRRTLGGQKSPRGTPGHWHPTKIESRSVAACFPSRAAQCAATRPLNLSLPPSCFSSLLLRTKPALSL